MPRITQKGQVTIPKDIRDKLGVKLGSSVRFSIVEGRCILEKETEETKAEKWVGYLDSQKKTDEVIEELRGKIKDTDLSDSE